MVGDAWVLSFKGPVSYFMTALSSHTIPVLPLGLS